MDAMIVRFDYGILMMVNSLMTIVLRLYRRTLRLSRRLGGGAVLFWNLTQSSHHPQPISSI